MERALNTASSGSAASGALRGNVYASQFRTTDMSSSVSKAGLGGPTFVSVPPDFTVLDADPHQVSPAAIREIGIWGTLLDGRPHPIPRGDP